MTYGRPSGYRVLGAATVAQILQFQLCLQGLAAFIVTDAIPSEEDLRAAATNNEIWSTYPDSNDGRTQYPGDTRAALAPLLAHRALRGRYRWQLYGDDDTIWFANGVLELVQKLDADMPYMITGKNPLPPLPHLHLLLL